MNWKTERNKLEKLEKEIYAEISNWPHDDLQNFYLKHQKHVIYYEYRQHIQ